MNRITRASKSTYCALAACILFLATGSLFPAKLGVQNDESLFANGIYKPYAVAYVLKVGHSRLPLMLMSYLGTVKSWIYRPIFQLFGAGTYAMRIPMVLAGAASVWLFFLLLRRIAGIRAAVIGCGILATDSLYLLTVCFDWGPVALQHLLLIGGMLLLVRFYQEKSHAALGWGFFLLGLMMWDKALAIWTLSGLGLALLLIMPVQIWRSITPRRVAIAILSFALGALPLIIYNGANHFVTFRGNTSWDTSDIPGKARLLRGTAEGGALFGWLNFEDWQTQHPSAPNGVIETASAEISALDGHTRHTLLLYGFILALVLAPFARGNALRAILIALIAGIVAWIQMAITANAGGSVHHAILIWPLPQVIMAVSFASVSRKLGSAGIPAVAVIVALIMASGLLVTNEYYALMVRNGGSQNWTDAIFRLADWMKPTSSPNVYCVDWGMMDSLRLLSRGKLRVRVGTDPITKAQLDEKDREFLGNMIGAPEHLFINHTKPFEFFAGVNDKLVQYASTQGYRREILTVIPDSHGREVYEVYHFVK